MDIVYTWVDGADPSHQRTLRRYLAATSGRAALSTEDVGPHRFNDLGELRYSLRSLDLYAPWANRIYIVTNGQVPRWLNLTHPQLRLVTHEEIFPDPSVLPTFNSNAIEANLHRISGLADEYLYFNDDFLLSGPVTCGDFWSSEKGHVVYQGSLLIPPTGSDEFAHITGDGVVREMDREEVMRLRMELSAWIHGLQHTNHLLDQEFNPRRRRSIAHVPTFFQASTMRALSQKWGAALDRTSRQRFRTSQDVVISYLYGNFVLERAQRETSLRATPIAARGGPYHTLRLGKAAGPAIEAELTQVQGSPSKFLCIQPQEDLSEEAVQKMQESLERRYPSPSRFER